MPITSENGWEVLMDARRLPAGKWSGVRAPYFGNTRSLQFSFGSVDLKAGSEHRLEATTNPETGMAIVRFVGKEISEPHELTVSLDVLRSALLKDPQLTPRIKREWFDNPDEESYQTLHDLTDDVLRQESESMKDPDFARSAWLTLDTGDGTIRFKDWREVTVTLHVGLHPTQDGEASNYGLQIRQQGYHLEVRRIVNSKTRGDGSHPLSDSFQLPENITGSDIKDTLMGIPKREGNEVYWEFPEGPTNDARTRTAQGPKLSPAFT